MNNVTALIYYYRDAPERERNFRATASWLRKNEIKILALCDGHKPDFLSPDECIFSADGYYQVNGMIHRTKALNFLARTAQTKYIIVQDTDIIIPSEQISATIKELDDGTGCVYCYDGTFWRIEEQPSAEFSRTFDIKSLRDTPQKRRSISSVGGSIWFRRDHYLECGGENENFVSYCPEDSERFIRFSQLGAVKRIKGPVYHLFHHMGKQSRPELNPFFKSARDELKKIQLMNADQLKEYVKTWEWCKV